jgi:uncharacterized protein (TIGR02217 family)
MSSAIYPTLPGLALEVGREYQYSTQVQTSPTGKELRVSQRTYPIVQHALRYNFLRDTSAYPELGSLLGFYKARQGDADNFYFTDPDDNTATNLQIGTGNGSNRDFQLVMATGSYLEPVFNPNTITAVTVNGTGAGYVLQANGVVRMNSAPAGGAVVRWSGTYYYRSRFADASLSIEKFLHQVWQGRAVRLLSSLQDKI